MSRPSTPVTAPPGRASSRRRRRAVRRSRRVLGDPCVVGQPVADDDVHHRQHHGDVGAGQRLDELVAAGGIDGVGGERADRIDHDEACTACPGRLDGRPEVTVGELGVRAPQQDQLRVFEFERVHAPPGAVRHPHAGADGRTADRPNEVGRAHVSEESAAEPHHRQQALVAGVGERQHRLGTVLVDDAVQPVRDLGQRLVPRDLLELAGSLRADAAQRVQQSVGAYTRSMNRLTFGHSSPAEYGWSALPRSLTATRASLDGDRPAARVGTVVVAGAVDRLRRHAADATRWRVR